MAHEIQDGGFTLSDDPDRFDLDRAHGWISRDSYWAEAIPMETFVRSCANSLVVGAYDVEGAMVSMARVVTDRATFGWICDVFVDAGARGIGLGKRLMGYLQGHPDLQGLRRLHLATRDAHGLYARFGFTPLSAVENWMEIRDPEIYRRRS